MAQFPTYKDKYGPPEPWGLKGDVADDPQDESTADSTTGADPSVTPAPPPVTSVTGASSSGNLQPYTVSTRRDARTPAPDVLVAKPKPAPPKPQALPKERVQGALAFGAANAEKFKPPSTHAEKFSGGAAHARARFAKGNEDARNEFADGNKDARKHFADEGKDRRDNFAGGARKDRERFSGRKGPDVVVTEDGAVKMEREEGMAAAAALGIVAQVAGGRKADVGDAPQADASQAASQPAQTEKAPNARSEVSGIKPKFGTPVPTERDMGSLAKLAGLKEAEKPSTEGEVKQTAPPESRGARLTRQAEETLTDMAGTSKGTVHQRRDKAATSRAKARVVFDKAAKSGEDKEFNAALDATLAEKADAMGMEFKEGATRSDKAKAVVEAQVKQETKDDAHTTPERRARKKREAEDEIRASTLGKMSDKWKTDEVEKVKQANDPAFQKARHEARKEVDELTSADGQARIDDETTAAGKKKQKEPQKRSLTVAVAGNAREYGYSFDQQSSGPRADSTASAGRSGFGDMSGFMSRLGGSDTAYDGSNTESLSRDRVDMARRLDAAEKRIAELERVAGEVVAAMENR